MSDIYDWLPDLILNKIDRFSTVLLNAIPDQGQAETIVEQLLKPLTEPENK